MIDPESQKKLKAELALRLEEDRSLLKQLRKDMRPLISSVRRIQPRVTTAVSLVATDGGNNKLQFDPFLVQLIRVVDSSNNEYSLEVVTPSTNLDELASRQFNVDGTPVTPLGEMMEFLEVRTLPELSNFIRASEDNDVTWIKSYRELVEWATLFSILKNKDFGSDVLIVFDGLLRTKHFARDLFRKLREGIDHYIEINRRERHRRIYIAGIAKHSQVLMRYRLAMNLENVLNTTYPAYVEVPRAIEAKTYRWPEFSFEDDREGEINKFVGGKLFFVKFGSRGHDPIWPIDILLSQVSEAQTILGYLLSDAFNGFPIPFYPLCLQRAHEHAALVGFDMTVLQDSIYDGIRQTLGTEAINLDIFRFQDADPAQRRYE
jgi:hypothetical protein